MLHPPNHNNLSDVRNGLLALLGFSYLIYASCLDKIAGTVGIVCPFRLMTGWNCPLCGMTHSWHALLHGKLDKALSYHPIAPFLFPLWVILSCMFAYLYLSRYFGKKKY